MVKKYKRNCVSYPSCPSSSPCSLPFPSSSSLCLWNGTAVLHLLVSQIPVPCPGPIPARHGLAPAAASLSPSLPTDPGLPQLRDHVPVPALAPCPCPCPCLCHGLALCPCLARAWEGAAGLEGQPMEEQVPSPFQVLERLCGSPAKGEKKTEQNIRIRNTSQKMYMTNS